MALHHLSAERPLYFPPPYQPAIVPREHPHLESVMEVGARSEHSLLDEIRVMKMGNPRGHNELHVNLPPRFCEPEHFIRGKANVWVGYSYPEFLDGPEICNTSETREISLNDRLQPVELSLPLHCGMNKQITVHIQVRNHRGVVSRFRLSDQEVERVEVLQQVVR